MEETRDPRSRSQEHQGKQMVGDRPPQGAPDMPSNDNQCMREKTVDELLRERIIDLQNDVSDLKMLRESLPQKMPERAEKALRKLIYSTR